MDVAFLLSALLVFAQLFLSWGFAIIRAPPMWNATSCGSVCGVNPFVKSLREIGDTGNTNMLPIVGITGGHDPEGLIAFGGVKYGGQFVDNTVIGRYDAAWPAQPWGSNYSISGSQRLTNISFVAGQNGFGYFVVGPISFYTDFSPIPLTVGPMPGGLGSIPPRKIGAPPGGEIIGFYGSMCQCGTTPTNAQWVAEIGVYMKVGVASCSDLCAAGCTCAQYWVGLEYVTSCTNCPVPTTTPVSTRGVSTRGVTTHAVSTQGATTEQVTTVKNILSLGGTLKLTTLETQSGTTDGSGVPFATTDQSQGSTTGEGSGGATTDTGVVLTGNVLTTEDSNLTESASTTHQASDSVAKAKKKSAGFDWLPIVIAVGAALCCAICVIVAIVIVRKRRGNKKKNPESVPMSGAAPPEVETEKEVQRQVQKTDNINRNHYARLPLAYEIAVPSIIDRIIALSQPVADARAAADGLVGFDTEFSEIEAKSAAFTAKMNVSVAMSESNFMKNRYRNILAGESSRVKLATPTADGSDYINANWISGLVDGSEKAYIACQGPLPHTVSDFWQMVWETKSSVILMLTRVEEDGRVKCEHYWPKDSKSTDYGGFRVRVVNTADHGEYVDRKLSLTNNATKEERTVMHFQYTGWPDQGIPDSCAAYLILAESVDEHNQTHGPIVVHCSAGVGRTGTFCVIHSALAKLRSEHIKNKTPVPQLTVNIGQAVIDLRKQRPSMVQTAEQYKFCYVAINDGAQRILAKKDVNYAQLPEFD